MTIELSQMKRLTMHRVELPRVTLSCCDILETIQDGKPSPYTTKRYTTKRWIQLEVRVKRKAGTVHNVAWLTPKKARQLAAFLLERATELEKHP